MSVPPPPNFAPRMAASNGRRQGADQTINMAKDNLNGARTNRVLAGMAQDGHTGHHHDHGSDQGHANGAGGVNRGVPGSEFMSNEDIHKFSEHLRKEARHRAVLRAMDAHQLEAVLRNIPDTTGSMSGARMRARRVSRNLKKIASAEQVIAKSAAALYAAFEREYEAELRKVGRGRANRNVRQPFGWQ